jgi:hypothetical protein
VNTTVVQRRIANALYKGCRDGSVPVEILSAVASVKTRVSEFKRSSVHVYKDLDPVVLDRNLASLAKESAAEKP